MITIHIRTKTSTTPATTGFASAYGAILMGPTYLRTHQGYAYYDTVEIELLACLKMLELCEKEGLFQHDPHVMFVTDNHSLRTQIQQIQNGFIHSAVQQAIWDHLQDFCHLTIDFADSQPELTLEIEAVVHNELFEGLLQAMDHLVETNRKVSVLCSQHANKNTLLFAPRVIETAQRDNLCLYLYETRGYLFEGLLTQAIHQKIEYHIVGTNADCHAATYIYANNPILWLAQQTSRAYGITPASASDKMIIASAVNLFEQRHKIGRLLTFKP
jgi:hypothetical protein